MNTKTLCLGVLILGKASGYDIGKKLERTFGHFMDVASSGVYPALKSLHQEGLVDFEQVDQSSLPSKKIYELTEKGKEAFKLELSELPPRHKVRSQFILLIFFAELLPVKRMQEVFSERINELEYWSTAANEWLVGDLKKHSTVSQVFIAEYILAVMTAEKDFLEKNSAGLLEKLIDKSLSELSDEN